MPQFEDRFALHPNRGETEDTERPEGVSLTLLGKGREGTRE